MNRFKPGKLVLQLLLIFIFVLGVVFLYSGNELLGKPIISGGELPFGTVISWVVLAIFPLFFHLWFKDKPKIRKSIKLLLKLALFLGISWGIFSFILAGNWHFSFKNNTYFIIWIAYTATIIFLPLIGLLTHFLLSFKRI